MNDSPANPLLVGLLFVLRCLVPILVMLGISYLLRRFGLIQQPSVPPADWEREPDETEDNHHDNSGSLANEHV